MTLGPLPHGTPIRGVGLGQEGNCGRVGSVCLGPVSGLLLPAGPMEEVELQVFPDPGLDTEEPGAVGDGQVCVDLSLGGGA